MMTRTQISFEHEMLQDARRRAAELGVSLAEYLRRLVAEDLGDSRPTADPSAVFNLGRSRGSDVARHKDEMIAEAVARGRRR